MYNGETIEEKDLSYDWRFYPRFYRHIAETLDSNEELEYILEEIREGLMVLKDSIEESFKEIFRKLKSINSDIHVDGKIREDEYGRRDLELMSHYRLLYPRK